MLCHCSDGRCGAHHQPPPPNTVLFTLIYISAAVKVTRLPRQSCQCRGCHGTACRRAGVFSRRRGAAAGGNPSSRHRRRLCSATEAEVGTVRCSNHSLEPNTDCHNQSQHLSVGILSVLRGKLNLDREHRLVCNLCLEY